MKVFRPHALLVVVPTMLACAGAAAEPLALDLDPIGEEDATTLSVLSGNPSSAGVQPPVPADPGGASAAILAAAGTRTEPLHVTPASVALEWLERARDLRDDRTDEGLVGRPWPGAAMPTDSVVVALPAAPAGHAGSENLPTPRRPIEWMVIPSLGIALLIAAVMTRRSRRRGRG